jgi:hypothetical protein
VHPQGPLWLSHVTGCAQSLAISHHSRPTGGSFRPWSRPSLALRATATSRPEEGLCSLCLGEMKWRGVGMKGPFVPEMWWPGSVAPTACSRKWAGLGQQCSYKQTKGLVCSCKPQCPLRVGPWAHPRPEGRAGPVTLLVHSFHVPDVARHTLSMACLCAICGLCVCMCVVCVH